MQKYVVSEETDKRLKEIKDSVSAKPDHLHVIICDEAHYGLNDDADEKETAYSKLLADWNSDQYKNVVVVMVSATPWNLLTVRSKLENNAHPDDKSLRLHVCGWTESLEGDFKQGKEMKLLV